MPVFFGRRVKFFRVSADWWLRLLSLQLCHRCISGIPRGARIVGLSLDPLTNQIRVAIEHVSFPCIALSQVPPEITVKFAMCTCHHNAAVIGPLKRPSRNPSPVSPTMPTGGQ